jgi:hypothetical protein
LYDTTPKKAQPAALSLDRLVEVFAGLVESIPTFLTLFVAKQAKSPNPAKADREQQKRSPSVK